MAMGVSRWSMRPSRLVSTTGRASTGVTPAPAAAWVGMPMSLPSRLTAVPPLLPPAMVASVLIQARRSEMPFSWLKPETLPLVKVTVSPPMPG